MKLAQTPSDCSRLIGAAILTLALAIAPIAADAFTCPTVTTLGATGNCGIVITAPGCYQILVSQVDLSDTADCVQIASSKVVLLLDAPLTGTGATSTADGIHVLATTPGGGASSAIVGGLPITNVTIITNAQGIFSFNNGVESDANDVRIDGIQALRNNANGILLSSVKANRVSGAAAEGNGESGIAINGSSGNLVSDCNLSEDGNGVSLTNSNGNTVSGSTLNASFGAGAQLQTSNDNRLTGNTANGNGDFGFALSGSSANTLSANTTDNNSVGITIDNSPATEVSANVVQGNSFNGIELSNNDGGSHIDSNSVSTTNGFGIHVNSGSTALTINGNGAANNAIDLDDDNPGCANNQWFGNSFISSSQTCIH